MADQFSSQIPLLHTGNNTWVARPSHLWKETNSYIISECNQQEEIKHMCKGQWQYLYPIFTFSHVCLLIIMYWIVVNYWFVIVLLFFYILGGVGAFCNICNYWFLLCVFFWLFFSMQYLCYDYELCMLNVEIKFCSVVFCSNICLHLRDYDIHIGSCMRVVISYRLVSNEFRHMLVRRIINNNN